MLDLAIVLALVVLNAFGHSAYLRWRAATPKRRRVGRLTQRRTLSYPTHPSPGFAEVPEHTVTVRPIGIDW